MPINLTTIASVSAAIDHNGITSMTEYFGGPTSTNTELDPSLVQTLDRPLTFS